MKSIIKSTDEPYYNSDLQELSKCKKKIVEKAKHIIKKYIKKDNSACKALSLKKFKHKPENEDIIYSSMINAMLQRLPVEIKTEAKLNILNLVKNKKI